MIMTNNINWKKLLQQILITFVLLIIVYYGLLFASYLIPDNWIDSNWQESVDVIASEEKRWEVISNIPGTRLDTFTDNLIFQKLNNTDSLSAASAAVWNNGYFRYWMGDIPILRFLLIFMNYTGIRFLNIFVIFSLFLLVIIQIAKQVTTAYAMLFSFALMTIHFWIFPLSLQYSPVYIISMVAILALMYLDTWKKLSPNLLIITFFVIGSITNYFDLLTAPLITFALPFFLLFLLHDKNKETTFMTSFIETIYLGVFWIFGYALTWVSKWIVSTVILQENTFKSAINQIFLRTQGTDEEVLEFTTILRRVLATMFPNYVLLLIGVLFLVWLVLWFKYRKPIKSFIDNGVLLLMSLVPFVWTFILQNHNQHHYYFTYRHFIILLLGVFTYLYLAIDWTRIGNKENYDKTNTTNH